MRPVDALRSATVVAAELFGVEGVDGTIAVGNKADVIAVAGNPVDDIALLQEVAYVIKSGQVVKREGEMQLPVDFNLPQKY